MYMYMYMYITVLWQYIIWECFLNNIIYIGLLCLCLGCNSLDVFLSMFHCYSTLNGHNLRNDGFSTRIQSKISKGWESKNITTKIRNLTQLETSCWPFIIRDSLWYSCSVFYWIASILFICCPYNIQSLTFSMTIIICSFW